MKCSKCGTEFVKIANRTSNTCNPCNAKYQREYMREYRTKNAEFEAERHKQRMADPEYVERSRRRTRKYWQDLRRNCILAYGGYVCACCGETEKKFLSLDHANNDGYAHRKELGSQGQVMKWLRDNNYPPGFQVLCFNCNLGKAQNNGICPHKSTHVMQTV